MQQMQKQHLDKNPVRRLIIGLALLVVVGCTATSGAPQRLSRPYRPQR